MSLIRNINRLTLQALSVRLITRIQLNPLIVSLPIQKRFLTTDQDLNIKIKNTKAVPHTYRCSVNDPVSLKLQTHLFIFFNI